MLCVLVGSRKSTAMSVFATAFHNIYGDSMQMSNSLFSDTDIHVENRKDPFSEDTPLPQMNQYSTPYSKRPYMVNGTFTMASLASKIDKHDGQYMLMYDEMSMLLKIINKDSNDSVLRQQFLTMANGDGIARSTSTAGEEYAATTNVNFCGKR
jgi:hypothetical protein